MKIEIDDNMKYAIVWCSHADKADEAKAAALNEFIAECRAKKIYVCVFESGDGDLLENTRELLAYNYNNPVPVGAANH